MIVKNLYNLVSAYDEQPPNYTNIGYATGAMAYYMVQMSEGKGMFGFIALPTDPSSLNLNQLVQWDLCPLFAESENSSCKFGKKNKHDAET